MVSRREPCARYRRHGAPTSRARANAGRSTATSARRISPASGPHHQQRDAAVQAVVSVVGAPG